jgi:hypothetical protein
MFEIAEDELKELNLGAVGKFDRRFIGIFTAGEARFYGLGVAEVVGNDPKKQC